MGRRTMASPTILPGPGRWDRSLAGIALLDALSTGTTIVAMLLLSQIVATVFLAQQALTQVLARLLWLLGVFVLHAGLVWWREIAVQRQATRYKRATRQRLFAHLLQAGPAYGKMENSGELVTVLYEGVERLEAYVSRYLPQINASVLTPLLVALAVLPVDWISAVLLLATAPVIPLLMMLVGSFAEKRIQRQWLALSRLGAALLDAIQGVTTLKLFGQSGAMQSRIERISEQFRRKTLHMLRVAFLSGAVLEFLIAGAIGLVAVMLGVRLIDHVISFEHALLILLLAPEFYRPLRELGVQHHAGMEGKAAARRIDEILAVPVPSSAAPSAPASLSQPLTLKIADLDYAYPDSARPALSKINLELRAGTCTALIGRSGAGKSTLVNLLLRFLPVQGGQIQVNGVSINDLPLDYWRSLLALVPQHPFLFAGSVLENLRLARPAASDEEIARAVELAGAAEFIAHLPQGYATLLGERGARLSAGQAQRLAIARAFLKDAPLLILDEPTSSLDPVSETQIRQALTRLVAQRTVLVIAHRQNTIASADQVARLERGQLVEVGPPASFVHRPELFPDPHPARLEALS